MEGYTTE
jgi:hypothetical protein